MDKNSTDKKIQTTVFVDMTEIRQKYALKREAFAPLNELFQDTPPAHELIKLLSK
jgi:DNA-binding transcriptional regulator YiaG